MNEWAGVLEEGEDLQNMKEKLQFKCGNIVGCEHTNTRNKKKQKTNSTSGKIEMTGSRGRNQQSQKRCLGEFWTNTAARCNPIFQWHGKAHSVINLCEGARSVQHAQSIHAFGTIQ